jgi:hypothetical protein
MRESSVSSGPSGGGRRFYDLHEDIRQIYLTFGKTLKPARFRALIKTAQDRNQERPDVVLAMRKRLNVWTVLFCWVRAFRWWQRAERSAPAS